MKIRQTLISVALVLACSTGAQAALEFVLDPALMTADPGTSVTFAGSLRNTGAEELFINNDSFTLYGLTLDDSRFFADVPMSLPASGYWSGSFFDVFADISTAPGDYVGAFQILGGPDGDAQDLLAEQNFLVKVSPAGEAVPELGSIPLAVLGLLPVLARFRRR